MAARSSLNPNALEFVPSTLRSSGIGQAVAPTAELSRFDSSSSAAEQAKAAADGVSLDEDLYQQYWLSQLPDNLISDFDVQSKVFEDGGGFGLEEQTVGYEAAVPHVTRAAEQYEQRLHNSRRAGVGRGSSSVPGELQEGGIPGSLYLGDNMLEHLQPDLAFTPPSETRSTWGDETDVNWSGWNNSRSSAVTFPEELVDVDPISLLTARFPGFAVKSLTDLLYANGGDLALTVEMLTQLELQEEGSVADQFQLPSASAPVSTPNDFPALAGYDLMSPREAANRSLYTALEADMRKLSTSDDYRASSPNFAAVARKGWVSSKGADAYQGLARSYSRTAQVDGYFGTPRLAVEEKAHQQHKFQLSSKAQRHTPKPWLDTGEAVSSLYADMREEARDHARARNLCFEQARQAYIAGNRALAKELSAKGHQLNDQMKAAHEKAGKAIFHERNAVIAGEFQKLTQGKASLLDLHGLHVKEAIVLLKQELKALRVAGSPHRSKQQLFVCVGTGHHTPGARVVARLPLAVKQYLATEEHDLQFSETEPGMLLITL